jgi:transcriptional regulator with PAS, ATPase and Fis domain
MESQRVVTAEVLKGYLPDRRENMSLVLTGGQRQENSFENEREILYRVLFDMRRDITDLKDQVKKLSAGAVVEQSASVNQPVSIITTTEQVARKITIDGTDDDIQDTEEYVEESLSLNEVEKDMIKRALQKHGGKRKDAARDLNISERTLYRKIKEYNLE